MKLAGEAILCDRIFETVFVEGIEESKEFCGVDFAVAIEEFGYDSL